MVESAANGIDDVLIENLSFKLKPGASYVQERKSVTFYASGSNEYSPAGTQLIKLVCTSESWMDPSTFRIAFDVTNKATTPTVTTGVQPNKLLRPLSGGWCFFSNDFVFYVVAQLLKI